MTTSHRAGPDVVFGQSTGGPTPDYNPDIGTSLSFGGHGTLDQRGYWAYRPGAQSYNGWFGIDNILGLNYVPSQLTAASIAASQTPTTAVALTLVTASALGAAISATVLNASTGATVAGLLLLDAVTATAVGSITGNVFTAASSTTGLFTVGSVLSGTGVTALTTIIGMAGRGSSTGLGTTGTYIVTPSQTVSAQVTISAVAGINGIPLVPGNTSVTSPMAGSPLGIGGSKLYNPICMLGRNVRITTASGDTAVYTVAGYDIYGFPMSEAITANGASTVSGKKAFKYIASVTPVGTVGATATVGTGDVYGFPLASLSFQDVDINWNATAITATTGYLAMVADTATTTTGDTRGTYNVQTASDGSKRLVIRQSPAPTNAGSNGTYGVTQA